MCVCAPVCVHSLFYLCCLLCLCVVLTLWFLLCLFKPGQITFGVKTHQITFCILNQWNSISRIQSMRARFCLWLLKIFTQMKPSFCDQIKASKCQHAVCNIYCSCPKCGTPGKEEYLQMLSLEIRERLQSSAALSSVTQLWGCLQNIWLAGRILLMPIALVIEELLPEEISWP